MPPLGGKPCTSHNLEVLHRQSLTRREPGDTNRSAAAVGVLGDNARRLVVDDVLIGRHSGHRLDENGARVLAGRQGGKSRSGERTLVGCGCEFRDPIEILACVGRSNEGERIRLGPADQHVVASPPATRRVAADLLLHLIKAVPYKVHTVLTDNGTHFTDPKGEIGRPPTSNARLSVTNHSGLHRTRT